MRSALVVLVMLIVPAAADACATCIGSAYGDRTYNWPYLALIMLPFMVAAVIGGVLARVSGVSIRSLRERLRTRRRHEC